MLKVTKLLFISTVVSVCLTIAATAQVKPSAVARAMDPPPQGKTFIDYFLPNRAASPRAIVACGPF